MSDNYQMLIWKAEDIDMYMADILRWYGDIGMELVENDTFGYVMKPIYQPEGGWQNESEWKHEKQWLLPYADTVTKLLKELKMEEEVCF